RLPLFELYSVVLVASLLHMITNGSENESVIVAASPHVGLHSSQCRQSMSTPQEYMLSLAEHSTMEVRPVLLRISRSSADCLLLNGHLLY
ncbi:hypothetical protein PMAYCL1PPCAC_11131, partial [Pristionchus mayeri]